MLLRHRPHRRWNYPRFGPGVSQQKNYCDVDLLGVLTEHDALIRVPQQWSISSVGRLHQVLTAMDVFCS